GRIHGACPRRARDLPGAADRRCGAGELAEARAVDAMTAALTNTLAEFMRGITLREALTAAVDILVVYYVIYRALLLVKGTRAAQMLTGVVLFAGAFYLARAFELNTLLWV